MRMLFDRESGVRSAALTLAEPRLCSGYPGNLVRECNITGQARSPDQPYLCAVAQSFAPLAAAG
jgi:hypothetical protein